ncbi:hypothetical protein ACFW7J_38330 [Streptomyces sp. NPDC059525]|uniref:YunG family protein n=1 Tax=Streptomyces sp. NPDC059525 TaxID=3346857 RepID=UPI00369F4350
MTTPTPTPTPAPASLLLTDIERAVRGSWSAETCTPEYRSRWTPDNPARDQCGVTAMVLNDLLGGEVVRGEVHVDGVRVDYHWWNRLGAGVDVDLTREQFGPEEIVTGGVVIPRPPVAEWRRLREEYELLRERVLAALDRRRAAAAGETSRQEAAEHGRNDTSVASE